MNRATSRNSVDERLRNWANASRGDYDGVDADRVERAWRRLDPQQCTLLRMVYIWGVPREIICRRLKIKRRPWHIYELELTAAKNAIEKILDDLP
jgi:hypothetical protein